MITKYRVFYKGEPITEALELHEAMKHIEKLRCLFLGVNLQRVEVADGADSGDAIAVSHYKSD